MTNHDHSNGHAHDHTAGANARQLTIAGWKRPVKQKKEG